MNTDERLAAYSRQTGRRLGVLTPPQRRRVRQQSNRAVAKAMREQRSYSQRPFPAQKELPLRRIALAAAVGWLLLLILSVR